MSKLQKIEIAADTSNTVVTLPEHLIIGNILPRLPVKTLIRFKSVSKLWLSSISSPQFVKSHLDCSTSSSSGQFLLSIRYNDKLDYRMSIKLMLLAYDELNNLKTPEDLGFPLCSKPNMQWVNIVGCSNGLVCLRYSTSLLDDFFLMGNSLLYVYNPATRENRKIKNPDGWHGWLLFEWFGHVPSVDDYCIVALFYGDNGRTMCVYFLRIGKWQIIKDVNGYLRSTSILYLTAVFEGSLYWSLEGISYESRPNRIIAFDLVKVQWKEFQWLDWLNNYDTAHFFILHGCLSLLCQSYSSSHRNRDVWTLKKQGDWSSWEKLCSIHIGDMCHVYSVTPTGKFMLGRYTDQFKIIGLNKDTKHLSQGDVYFSKEEVMSAKGYVESLVSPFGTIESNEEEDHVV